MNVLYILIFINGFKISGEEKNFSLSEYYRLKTTITHQKTSDKEKEQITLDKKEYELETTPKLSLEKNTKTKKPLAKLKFKTNIKNIWDKIFENAKKTSLNWIIFFNSLLLSLVLLAFKYIILKNLELEYLLVSQIIPLLINYYITFTVFYTLFYKTKYSESKIAQYLLNIGILAVSIAMEGGFFWYFYSKKQKWIHDRYGGVQEGEMEVQNDLINSSMQVRFKSKATNILIFLSMITTLIINVRIISPWILENNNRHHYFPTRKISFLKFKELKEITEFKPIGFYATDRITIFAFIDEHKQKYLLTVPLEMASDIIVEYGFDKEIPNLNKSYMEILFSKKLFLDVLYLGIILGLVYFLVNQGSGYIKYAFGLYKYKKIDFTELNITELKSYIKYPVFNKKEEKFDFEMTKAYMYQDNPGFASYSEDLCRWATRIYRYVALGEMDLALLTRNEMSNKGSVISYGTQGTGKTMSTHFYKSINAEVDLVIRQLQPQNNIKSTTDYPHIVIIEPLEAISSMSSFINLAHSITNQIEEKKEKNRVFPMIVIDEGGRILADKDMNIIEQIVSAFVSSSTSAAALLLSDLQRSDSTIMHTANVRNKEFAENRDLIEVLSVEDFATKMKNQGPLIGTFLPYHLNAYGLVLTSNVPPGFIYAPLTDRITLIRYDVDMKKAEETEVNYFKTPQEIKAFVKDKQECKLYVTDDLIDFLCEKFPITEGMIGNFKRNCAAYERRAYTEYGNDKKFLCIRDITDTAHESLTANDIGKFIRSINDNGADRAGSSFFKRALDELFYYIHIISTIEDSTTSTDHKNNCRKFMKTMISIILTFSNNKASINKSISELHEMKKHPKNVILINATHKFNAATEDQGKINALIDFFQLFSKARISLQNLRCIQYSEEQKENCFITHNYKGITLNLFVMVILQVLQNNEASKQINKTNMSKEEIEAFSTFFSQQTVSV